MTHFPLTLQDDIEAARMTLLRRRAYVATIKDVFDLEGGVDVSLVSVDRRFVDDFAGQASDEQRSRFFREAPAELAAAFVLTMPEAGRASVIAMLARFDRELFAKLLEGF